MKDSCELSNPTSPGAIRRVALLAVLAVALLPGCIFSQVRAPLDTNLEETNLGSKVGSSSAHIVLGLVSWGDAGTRAAALNGGIETITHADQEFMVILGFVYLRRTVIVYGD